MSTRIGVSSSLIAAIRDPMLTVTANAYFVASALDSSADYCDVTLTWMPVGNPADSNNVSKTLPSAILNATRNTGAVTLGSIGAGAMLRLDFNNFRQAQLAYGESGGWFGSGDDFISSAIGALISQVYIKIDIVMNQGLQFRTAASNFGDITIIDGEDRNANCAKDFVKPGDVFEVKTNLRYLNENLTMSYDAATADKFFITHVDQEITVKNEFRDFYFKEGEGADLTKVSTIEWNYESMYLERIIDGDFDITGQVAKFRVLDVPPGVITELELQPFLRKFQQGYSIGLNRTGHKLELRGDASPPEDPEINESDAFLRDYYDIDKWYSKGFQDGSPATRGVYINVEMSPASFITGNGSTQRMYYTTDGSDPIVSPIRKILVDNITATSTNRVVPLFFPMQGSEKQKIYTLRIVSYDYVGNISAVVAYPNIKIDCTDYFIEMFFTLGDKLSAAANSSSVAMLGTSELGTYKSETDKDFKKTATRGYRRGDLVYIQLSVKKSSQYRLFQYFNSGQRAHVCNYIDYGDFSSGDFGHFTEKTYTEVKLSVPDYSQQMAIVLTDEFLQDMENLKFYFIFKQQIPIMIGSTETVYDGAPKGIEQPTTIYSGIEILTYYKQTEEEDFVSQSMFTQAGSYFYKCEIVDVNYFGYATGPFIINKADPFVTGLEVQDIYYENSMGSASIRCTNTDPTKPDMLYSTGSSSDGTVAGSFKIVYPVDTTMAYIRPSQGEKNITVTFTPSELFEHNYNVMTYNTTLYVHYSTNLQISFQESTFSYTYQKDVTRYANAVTNPGNQQLIYEYKRQGRPDSDYDTKAPSEAGIYEVRVRTDLAICNYDNQKTTEGTDLKFIINRQAVLVQPTPAVCYYQNDFDPVAQAFLVMQGGNQYIPISDWRYEYFVNNQWIDTRPINSGEYQVRVIVDSENEYGEIKGNYFGQATTSLIIKKGNADAAAEYTIAYPSPINNPAINGHISYGQKLSQVNITGGAGYVAEYMFRTISQQGVESFEKRVVPGEYLFATRLFDPTTETIQAFVTEMKNTVLQVNRYTLNMTFVPGDLINFNISTFPRNITVVKAAPSFSNLLVSQLTYGDIAAELNIEHFIKVPGDKPAYSINEIISVGGVFVNPTVNGLPITGTLRYIDAVGKLPSAGIQKIAFSFTPDDDLNVRAVAAFDISVTVNKAVTDVEAVDAADGIVTKTYGNVFYNPAVNIYKYINDIKVQDNSFNVTYAYKNSLNEPVLMNAFTPAGEYAMTVEVLNNNFQGTLTQTLIIQKATPTLHTAPQAGTVKYMSDMSAVNLTSGKMQHPSTFIQVNGIFLFKDGTPPPPDGVGDRSYAVTFVPSDSHNYNSAEITVTINIKKADANVFLNNLVHTYSGIVKNPGYTTNIVIRNEGGVESYVDLSLPGNEPTEFDRPLAVRLTFNTPGNAIPVNANIYDLIATIDDANYEGTAQAAYVINKATANIFVDETSRVQAYNNGIISLKASARDLAGTPIKVLIGQTFSTSANVALKDAPRDVGIYNVSLDISDINYTGNTTSTLTITISQLNILNSLQTYGTRPPVLVEYMPSTASSAVSFQPVYGSELGDITDVQPTSAGMYKILINFPANLNNGYSASFESTLLINKAQVALSYNGMFKYTYSGLPRNQLTIDVNAVKVIPGALYVLRRSVQFFDDELGEFTSTEPVDVGSYVMVVSINDTNYAGSAEFVYTIEKASPVIRMHPIVSPLTYTDSGAAAVFDGGEVVFNGEIKSGNYSLVENTMNLEVGVHNVMYKFMPTDSRNLKEIFGTAQVNILQKDLSSEIVFYGATTVQYNQQPHYISAYIDSGENVMIDIFYNRSKSAPRERGVYVITAEVADKNYKGNAEWASRLTIIVGMPVIVSPKLTDIRVGDALGYSEIQGGFAYIRGTGKFVNDELVSGTASLIAGTFAFTRPDTIMDKANYREVELSFKPFASNNFSNVIFIATIKVIGQDPVIGTVVSSVKEAGKTIYYGQDLSNYNLAFNNVPDGATPGVLSFVDESVVPQVGVPVRYRFYPDNDAVYNIVEGDVAVAISKTTPSI
ncbi:MAG: MBG domain-containing protein, partial [Clostridia bacterium]|nr:MBG domain-containing protein [Clostridia bacterium]